MPREDLRSIDNRDVELFIPALVSATIDHEEVIECVQKLASTTFVQTVTAAPPRSSRRSSCSASASAPPRPSACAR